jgi:hypothetical protein
MHRLYHDFNKVWPTQDARMRSAPLVCRGTQEDLQRLSLTLREGMEVLLYMPDYDEDRFGALEVKASVRRDEKEHCFVADFIWDDLTFVPAIGREKNA